MKDPHVHAEKTPMPGFGHAATRDLIVRATGLVPDLPKTVGTGCGVRRPLAMTSTVPEKITCLACRDWAREEYLTWLAWPMPPRSSPRPSLVLRSRRRPPRLTCAPRSAPTGRWRPDSG